MPDGPMKNVLRQIRRLVARPAGPGQTDEELLEQFLVHREEEAFASLVRRHGPMVLGVCLRLLRNRHDAEDAFQATFLTLVRKGSSIRQRGALASWLYRVAFRISLRLKARAEKRTTLDCPGDAAIELDPAAEACWHELRPVLDAELQELPAKYRTPMILCYLEGRTYEQVANELGCPKGTVAIRLLRAREMLKRRLIRRGLVAGAGFVAATSVLPGASAAVSPLLSATTTGSAMAFSGGVALAASAPAGIAALVQEASRGWLQRRITTICAAAACVCVSGLGIGGGALSFVERSQPVPVASSAPPIASAVPVPSAVESPINLAVPAQPCQLVIVNLKFDQDGQLTSVPPPPKESVTNPGINDGRHSQPYVTLHVPEEAIDTVRAIGSVVLRAKNANRTMVVLVESNHDFSRCKPRAGLALRENLVDDMDWPRHNLQDASVFEPPHVAKSAPPKRSTRVIAVTHCGQLNLFSGMLRLVFLRPVNQTAPTL